jgi:agmatinase
MINPVGPPPYDPADVTAALADRVVLEALSAIARRRDATEGTASSPADPGIPPPAWDASVPLPADRPARGKAPE